MSQYQGQQSLNAFGSLRDEFRHRHKLRVLLYCAGASIWGYTNAAAPEFTREQGNQ
jgi:hypothetical protein